jgi:hypothetical protein
MAACGHPWPARPTSLARLARPGRPRRPALASRQPSLADAEVHWPSFPPGPHAGQVWAVEVELTPAADPALLDELPYLGDILPDLPPALRARLFAAVDLTILWNKTGGQTTVTATITESTLAALPAILDPTQDGYHDTAGTEHLGPLAQHPL